MIKLRQKSFNKLKMKFSENLELMFISKKLIMDILCPQLFLNGAEEKAKFIREILDKILLNLVVQMLQEIHLKSFLDLSNLLTINSEKMEFSKDLINKNSSTNMYQKDLNLFQLHLVIFTYQITAYQEDHEDLVQGKSVKSI